MWSDVDLLLLRAFQVYEDGLCGGCGQPLVHASDDDCHHDFSVAEITCYGCLAVEAKNDNNPPGKGVKRFVRNLMSQNWKR